MEEKLVKITDKLISIPPYLSTSWTSVAHIRTAGDRLVFTMKDGESISIPGFPDPLVKQVFECHIQYLESEMTARSLPKNFKLPEGMASPPELFRMGIGSPDMMNMMQHNGEQKNLPNLPQEVVEKISKILKVIAPMSDPDMFPKPEPHCNCPYCQIARSLHDMKQEEGVQVVEEIVTEQDLTFTQYQIEPCGDQLYSVTDRLFPAEKFTVFLGEPVGCTCGKSGCEHLIAVLKS